MSTHVQFAVETIGVAPEDDTDELEEEKKEKTTTKVWATNKKRKKGKAGPAKKKITNPKKVKKAQVVIAPVEATPSADEDSDHGSHDDNHIDGDSHGNDGGHSDSSDESGGDEVPKDEEEEWNRLQKNIKKQKELDRQDSHPVHAPYFPTVRLSQFVYIEHLSI